MSDDHDHSEHDHDHDHGHRHAVTVPPPPPTPPSEPEMSEDADSQALSEALKSSFGIIKVVMAVLVVVFLGSGFFKVGPQEKAVILHFGQPVGEGNKALLGPGLHWSFPYPIDEVVKIPFAEIQRVTSSVGWYFTTPEKEFNNQEDPAGPSLNPAVDGYAITGDGNIIHTRATLSYRIEDPIAYAFDFVSASNSVQNALNNSLLYAAARFKVDDVLTREIARFQEVVRARVTELVEKQHLGIVVEQCQVESKPPRILKPAFEAVTAAVSVSEKLHNDALSYENQTLSRAIAEASSRTNAAQAERVRLVESVRAEAKGFQDLLPSYRTDPKLFVNILLSEKIAQVLTNVQDKIYLPERADGQKRELRLQLSREPQAEKSAAQPQPGAEAPGASR
ncbi:MAG: Band 7 protein [Pedosphaera sp.]|nr:Band 7 protein [Pedosphaera sp.]